MHLIQCYVVFCVLYRKFQFISSHLFTCNLDPRIVYKQIWPPKYKDLCFSWPKEGQKTKVNERKVLDTKTTIIKESGMVNDLSG